MKKPNFSILYFLLIFLILYNGFYFYIGLSTPGGKVFIPFLYNYLNIPYWLSIVVVKLSMLLLKIMGFSVYQKAPSNITLTGSRGANIAWGCLGAGVMIVWLAFVSAHKANLKYKLQWIIGGILFIFFLNAFRVVIILISFYYHWHYFKFFNSHTLFNYVAYTFIIILMLIFIRSYNLNKSKQFKVFKQINT